MKNQVYFKPQSKSLIYKLEEKHKTYEKIINKTLDRDDIFDKRIVRDMINGKIVILVNTLYTDRFNEVYERISDQYVLSKEKYEQNYRFYLIPKKIIINSQLQYM